MRHWKAPPTFFLALAWILPPSLSAQETPYADLVLGGGKVITVDNQERIAEAVAVSAIRITAIGSNQEISRLGGPQTKIIELNGRSVLPGFIDAHSHVEGLAESEHLMVPIHAPPLKGGAEIIAKIRERAAHVPPGTWIVAQGTYNQLTPSREELDRNFPDHPLVLRWSAHDWLLNHKADEVAGLNAATPDPGGSGRIERTANGEPMILRDAGIELPLPRPTYLQMREWIPETLRDFYLKRGVTTVYDMSDPEMACRIYGEARDRNDLPVRLVLSYVIGTNDLSGLKNGVEDALLKSGLRTGFGDDWLRLEPSRSSWTEYEPRRSTSRSGKGRAPPGFRITSTASAGLRRFSTNRFWKRTKPVGRFGCTPMAIVPKTWFSLRWKPPKKSSPVRMPATGSSTSGTF